AGHCGPAHVEHQAHVGAFDLHVAGLPRQLTERHGVHGDTGGTDRVTLGLETARQVHGQRAATQDCAVFEHTMTLTLGRQTHGFVDEQFRNGEAVVNL